MDSIECHYCGSKINPPLDNGVSYVYVWVDCPTLSCRKHAVSYLFDDYGGNIKRYQSVIARMDNQGDRYELIINMTENKAHIRKHNYTTGKSEKIIDLPSVPSNLTLDNLADKIKSYLVFS
jgi:hypothetical protein